MSWSPLMPIRLHVALSILARIAGPVAGAATALAVGFRWPEQSWLPFLLFLILVPVGCGLWTALFSHLIPARCPTCGAPPSRRRRSGSSTSAAEATAGGRVG